MRPTFKSLAAVPAFALLCACSAASADSSNSSDSAEAPAPAPAPQASAETTAPADIQTPALNLPAGTYVTDLSHSSIIWSVNHLGLSEYTGRFNGFEAVLDIDPNDPEAASLTVAIDPTSVATGYPYTDREDFDAKVSGDANFLNSGAFPDITFTSTDIDMTGAETANVTGDLTMLGVTRPVTLDVTFNGALEQHPFSGRPMLGFSATTTLDRTDFGMDYLSGRSLGDDVKVVIQAEFGTDPAE
jgi:polyisoprenoid-binding protein YceI